jgi:hypothetical protein
MGLNRYLCPACGLSHERFISIRDFPVGSPVVVSCACGAEMIFAPEPGAFRTDLLPHGTTIDLGEGPQAVSSIQELRQIERESQRRAASGEGQVVNFRVLHQDRSDLDKNTFGASPYTPFSTKNRRGQPLVTKASGAPPE